MSKIINYKNLDKLLKKIKTRTKVLVGGCFDILHIGHLRFLKAAKKQGEILIVALESDEHIKRLKGKNRPVNQQIIRAKNLAKFKFIDYILLLPELNNDSYLGLVKSIRPNIIAVTKGDLRLEKKKILAKVVGAKVIEVIPYLKEYSTTKILETTRI